MKHEAKPIAFEPRNVGPQAAVLIHFSSELPRLIPDTLNDIAAGGDVVPDVLFHEKAVLLPILALLRLLPSIPSIHQIVLNQSHTFALGPGHCTMTR